MKDYTNSAPQFADKIKILEPTDPGHADNLNRPVEQLLQNTLVLKDVLKESSLMGGDEQAPNRLDVMQEDLDALRVPEIPELSEEDMRENISSGDDQPTLWKKVKKWFADLKAGAFASIVNNCTTTEEGTVLDGRQGKVLQDEIDLLKKSVADGKALIASAIRDKGIACGADVSYADMAANIRAISSLLRKVSIGTGNSDAARTFSATGIPNYNRLTKDNFVISAGTTTCAYSGNFTESAGNLTSGISYNSSNGILSVPQSTRKGHFDGNGTSFDKNYVSYTVYCFYV